MNEVFEKIIEKIEKERAIYFLTIANTGDKSLDVAYEKVGQAIDKSIEIVKQEAEKFGHDTNVGNNGWIPLSERLPENVDFVLFSNKDGEVETCTTEYFYDYRDEMIAWQPLPEPYQPKGE